MNLPLLLQFAAPVSLAAVGETISQKSGMLNIGLEGMMLAGAFCAMLACHATGSPWLGLTAGVAAAMAAASVAAWFCVKLAADQVVVGMAVNLLAIGVTSTLFRAQFGTSGRLLSVPGIPSRYGFDAVVLAMIVAAPLATWILARTSWGLALRAAGEYPKAAEAAGFSVDRLRISAMILGGALAGLGGGYLALGIAGSFAENMTAGRGFVAIAMVTFGRWNPIYVFLATLLVGYADSLQYAVQGMGLNVPFQLLIAAPYVLALLVLIVVGKGTMAPGALGQSYRRER